MMLPNISVYGSHNAGFAVEHNNKILEVVELERFLNIKNLGYTMWEVPRSQKYVVKLILDYFKQKYGFDRYENCLHQAADPFYQDIPANNYIESNHHESHAAGCFYQSPFAEAIVVSFDGGAPDGYFNIYKVVRGHSPVLIKKIELDVGGSYMAFGHYLADIKQERKMEFITYPGKILGLQSYGIANPEWLPHFINYYLDGKNYSSLPELGRRIGVPFNQRYTGQLAYDIAATSQAAFEQVTHQLIAESIEENPTFPICLTGGCALNIVFNTKLKEYYNRPVFVGPSPSDCGIVVGMLAGLIKPAEPIDVTYAGQEILDSLRLPEYIEQYNATYKTAEELSAELVSGKIVGLVQGRAEHGPRALGNRSIICNPLIADMKDKLNHKVKHREWYRPFAPVVRLEDVSEYFEWEGDSRWMSFCIKVKSEYLNVMPAIVHVDNTARVQTVTREENQFLYDLLTEFKKTTGIGVLLNTSFNMDGRPILSTYADALHVLNNTELDAVHLNGFYFTK